MDGIREGRSRNFVLGYVNGLEQLLSHYNFQIRSAAGKTFDAHVLDEALYKKLVNEPELRSGPVRETLMGILNDYAVLTDRVGNNLPSWQKLMSTSECAELMKVFLPKARNSGWDSKANSARTTLNILIET